MLSTCNIEVKISYFYGSSISPCLYIQRNK